MMRACAIACALSFALPAVAAAPPPGVEADQGTQRGPVVPAHLVDNQTPFWSIGVAFEGYGSEESGDALIGLASMLRVGWFGPNALIMLKPDPSGYEQSRFLGGLGLRAYFSLFDRSFSYGVGAHIEARLEDHFWLAYATPFELGATIYAERTWDVQL